VLTPVASKHENLAQTKGLEAAVDAMLKTGGFRKKGRSWYRDTAESIGALKLDKSPYGQLFSVYLGVLFKQLSPEFFPKVQDCHWYGKMTIPGANGEEMLPMLDLDKPPITTMALGSLKPVILTSIDSFVELIRQRGLPFLSRIQTVEGFKAAIEEGQFRHFPIGLCLIQNL